MDPFAIYEDLYISLREAVSGAMHDVDKIDTLTEVRIPYGGYNNVVCTVGQFLVAFIFFKFTLALHTDSEIFRSTIFLTSIVRKGNPQQSVW